MRRMMMLLVMAILLVLAGCSGSADRDSGTEGTVDRVTSEAADVVVDKIQTPLDAARMTQGMADQRLEAIEQGIQDQ